MDRVIAAHINVCVSQPDSRARTLPISAIWHYIEMYYINMPAAHISYNDLVIDARIPVH